MNWQVSWAKDCKSSKGSRQLIHIHGSFLPPLGISVVQCSKLVLPRSFHTCMQVIPVGVRTSSAAITLERRFIVRYSSRVMRLTLQRFWLPEPSSARPSAAKQDVISQQLGSSRAQYILKTALMRVLPSLHKWLVLLLHH